jgi:hypothetical protein
MDREFKLSALHNQVFGPDYEIGGLKAKSKRRLTREKKSSKKFKNTSRYDFGRFKTGYGSSF